eukprot:6474905-Amphidinium_carterae.1
MSWPLSSESTGFPLMTTIEHLFELTDIRSLSHHHQDHRNTMRFLPPCQGGDHIYVDRRSHCQVQRAMALTNQLMSWGRKVPNSFKCHTFAPLGLLGGQGLSPSAG